ncbi:ATP-binding protein [Zobellella taiwanensis]
MTQRKLPIGVQSFEKIRTGDYYYVDKTPYIHRLIEQAGYYFLSRPRRFGKSLLLDTLHQLFEAKEPLFRGLFIHNKWDWSRPRPVIRLGFGSGVMGSRKELDNHIRYLLRINRERLGLTAGPAEDISAEFAELIRRTHEQYGERVAVLIDEYDKPILDNITNAPVATELREGLKNLYSVLKDADPHLCFCLLTGVSKFSKVSLFSGLNNLNDITLDAPFSAICGYTEQDVDTVFAPELAGLDREQIKTWYNGYNWGGEAVYNPFDVLLLLQKREFRAYWFESATPTFLVKMLAERGFFTPQLDRLESPLNLLGRFDVDDISTEALLFQTGYLTIRRKEEPVPSYWLYTLGYPNREVEASLNQALLPSLGVAGTEPTIRVLRLLQANDFTGLEQHFRALFAALPHDWYRNNPIAKYEGHYASVFYSHIAALGLRVTVEDASNTGKVDMAVEFNGHVYLFEFKVVEQVPGGKALQQLKDRNYADKYRAQGLPIHLIGVEFSREQRQIVAFERELA